MLLQHPSLAEVPGFSKEQLDSLARSVESRRQQLESDIQDYIKSKQDELRKYERQVHTHSPHLRPSPFSRLAIVRLKLIWD
jgi:hypothetical protein